MRRKHEVKWWEKRTPELVVMVCCTGRGLAMQREVGVAREVSQWMWGSVRCWRKVETHSEEVKASFPCVAELGPDRTWGRAQTIRLRGSYPIDGP